MVEAAKGVFGPSPDFPAFVFWVDVNESFQSFFLTKVVRIQGVIPPGKGKCELRKLSRPK